MAVMAVLIAVLPFGIIALPQYYKSELKEPPSTPPAETVLPPVGPGESPADTLQLPGRVHPTVPRGYDDYNNPEYPADLRDPSNIKTEVEYDPELGLYVFKTMVGDHVITTPYMMTPDQYENMMMRRDMYSYFNSRNTETFYHVIGP